ncbi:uncharacterized protein LOC125861794 [Solanum stenotomum]|uniref:uncharacterized protein LOC125861794 n=1 Tax=Solanum stenotomum TaxID=172797 RepID=UPI0020D04278|nr:uncharacterized protein LOC125861794 [Solanum stenotomum]
MSLEKYFFRVPKTSLAPQNQNQLRRDENVNQIEISSHSSQRQEFDVNDLKADPAERTPILNYHPNLRDEIRRAYIIKGPCQPQNHQFPQTNFFGTPRRFVYTWFDEYRDWLEYSISADAAYCLPCYLFQGENINQGGGNVFSTKGFTNWHRKDSFATHIGLPNSVHNQSKRKCEDLMREQQSIQAAFYKLDDKSKHEYRIRLNTSIDVVRLLLDQGFAFRGHDESESSLNKGNFLEVLSWLAARCDAIKPFVLEKAPKNNKMTSHDIQKDIVTACKIETVKAIIKDINSDYFALLVDESRDVSRKEQMAICLRYVDKMGFVMEAFIGLVHIKDTSALSLKKAIVDVLAHHSLTLSNVRGQCYDGASNMQGELGGLKTLIRQESRSAHSVHCFAHQLQLTLVAVSKKCVQVGELVLLISNILNVLGASFKRVDNFRESQKKHLQMALDMGELETGRGLNQELGLVKAGDTRWGSHYKSFGNFISSFDSIVDVLDTLVENASTLEERASASGFLRSCQTFETIFLLHLMTDVLGITNDLNVSLQKKEQDIANAMILVKVAKRRLQALRDNEWDPLFKKNIGWDSLKEKVEAFCIKHGISLPNFDDPYANSGRSRRKVVICTTLHHYRVDVFYKIIDWQLQELNDRFNEVTSDLLNGVSCLNPIDSFSSFDIKKIMRMAELYPDDFDGSNMRALENQLVNYIIDVRDIDERFSNLGGLGELSRKLVETKKHLTYSLVFLLVKFALLLPVATATVERAFSAMKIIKNDLRNRMDDEFLDGCIVPYVEKKVFKDVSNECIMKTFQEMKCRRVQL